MLQTLQACRALAALLVVMFHAGGTLAKAKYFGPLADAPEHLAWFSGGARVAFFFVASGFIIHRIHGRDIGRPERLTGYLARRAIRIYPPFLIVFACVWLVAMSTPALRASVPSDTATLLAAALLLPQDPAVVGSMGAPVLFVAWSLQFEIAFYAAFAVALASRWVFLAVVALYLAYAVKQWVAPVHAFPYSFFASHLLALFGFGMLADVAVRSRTPLARPLATATFAVVLLAALAVAAALWRDESIKPLFDAGYGVASAVLLFALARHETAQPLPMRRGALSRLGDASYAIYLVHAPLITVFGTTLAWLLPHTAVGAWTAYAGVVVLCVGAGLMFHRCVERPLVTLLKRAVVDRRMPRPT